MKIFYYIKSRNRAFFFLLSKLNKKGLIELIKHELLISKSLSSSIKFLIYVKIFNLLYKDNIKRIPYSRIDSEKKVLIHECNKEVIVYPPYYGTQTVSSKIKEQPMVAYLLHKALTYSGSSLILNEENYKSIFETKYRQDVIYRDYRIIDANVNSILYFQRASQKKKSINTAISLLGKGSWNYFHALLEFIPKLYFIRELHFAEMPVLVDAQCQQYPAIMEVLSLFDQYEFVFIEKDEEVSVNQLYYISSPFEVSFNKRTPFDTNDLNYNSFILEYIAFIREKLIAESSALTSKFPDKIFLTRKNKTRRYNERDVEELTEEKGLTRINTETLSLQDQINLFYHAKLIVGPTGASWTNLIFCRPSTEGVIWMNENWGDFPVFSTLAQLVKVKLLYIHTTNCEDHVHGAYHIDVDLLKQKINEIESMIPHV